MKLNMQIILEHLETLKPVYHGKKDNHLTIIGCKLLTKSTENIQSDVLYIGNQAEFLEYSSLDQVKFLVCKGIPKDLTLNKSFYGEGIFVDSDQSLIELYEAVSTIFDIYNRWDESLKKVLLGKKDLKQLLEISYSMIRNPIALFDKSFRCITYCGEGFIPENDPIWSSILADGHVNLELVPTLRAEKITPRLYRAKEAFIYSLPGINYNCIYSNIFIEKDSVASLSLTETQTTFTPKTLILLNYISELFSLALVKDPLFKNAIYDIDQLSITLLEEGLEKTDILEYWLSLKKWSLKDKYQVLIFQPRNKIIDNSASTYVHNFQQLLREDVIFIYEDDIIVIRNLSKSLKNDQDLTPKIPILLEKLDYFGGISYPFQNYLDLKIHYLQAKAALSKAQSGKKENRLTNFDDILIDEILNTCSEKMPVPFFCLPEILLLDEVDHENNTDYVNCIYVYFSNGKNLIETAANLFIHRNTLIYRLKKIQDLIGDFNQNKDPDYVLKVLLSCQTLLKMDNFK